MARGWESKSVEDQQAEVEARREANRAAPPSVEDRERQAKRMALGRARARVLQDLQAACHPHHRATLEQSLAHLDRELEALDNPG